MQEKLQLEKTPPSLSPDYKKKCPKCGTQMAVCVTPGTHDSWMYNCLNIDCEYHDPEADQVLTQEK